MSRPLFSPLVERAVRFAAFKHDGHRRKASELPYVSHLAAVALVLAKAGLDDDAILAAALLHDVVEDTPCTPEELAAEFPANVVAWVLALTERKRDAAGEPRPWRDRKDEHLAHVAEAPWQARAIVLADKLHNLGSMVYDLDAGEELWGRFNAVREDILWYNRAMIAAGAGGDARLEPLADACREMLERVEGRLKVEG
ncbi:MAG: HD domain-containing protein [Planctomycetales bacterium]